MGNAINSIGIVLGKGICETPFYNYIMKKDELIAIIDRLEEAIAKADIHITWWKQQNINLIEEIQQNNLKIFQLKQVIKELERR